MLACQRSERSTYDRHRTYKLCGLADGETIYVDESAMGTLHKSMERRRVVDAAFLIK